MASVQCLKGLSLKGEAANQYGVIAIAMNYAAATWLDLAVVPPFFFGDLVVALVEADQIVVLNLLSTGFVMGC
jgi:hypothetical protein